jgi:hypothetical protein
VLLRAFGGLLLLKLLPTLVGPAKPGLFCAYLGPVGLVL